MRKSRKLMSILLVVAMLFTLVSPAMAAPTNTTISVAADDNRTYDVYQIFTGELHNGVLSNIKWGENGTGTKDESVAQTVLDDLASVNGLGDNYQGKLDIIKKYVNLSSNAYTTVSNAQPVTVPTGYYLFVDKGVAGDNDNFDVPDKEALSLYVVNVVGPTEIEPKRGTVESQKKVKDTNNSTNETSDWQDSADHDINDEVQFQLTGTLPADYANYKTYYYAFHDKESAGLDFMPGTVKVYVVNGTTKTEVGTDYYRVVTPGADEKCKFDERCTFEVVFADLKAIKVNDTAIVNKDSKIVVEYTSTLNEDAVIGSAGNPNEMYLEYSNNPNWEGAGSEGPTGETPKDKVIVFTYKVVVNKVTQKYDENGQPVKDGDKNVYEELKGAVFTLYKYDDSATTEDKYVEVENKEFADPVFTWKGLDDGKYKLVETTTPPGYNTIEPIEFTITAEHEILSDNPALTSLSGNVTSGEVTFTSSTTDCSLTTDVVNNSGATLPETGGIGTTIFYVIGGALVLGAAVLLVTRKRMAE